jgi:hypothetical protein
MKTAYELAIERLNKMAPPPARLTDEQKKQIAELESRYKAKIAEREIALQSQIDQAAARGDFEEIEKLQARLAEERRALQAELEAKKEEVRKAK